MPYVHRNEDGSIGLVLGAWTEGFAEEFMADDDPELIAFYNPPLTPLNCPLSPDQFYTMLENEGKLDAFIAAIETVTPTSKKLTCRNQFNNATEFTWDMILVAQVMPKATIYGVTWQDDLPPIWVNAYQTLAAMTA